MDVVLKGWLERTVSRWWLGSQSRLKGSPEGTVRDLNLEFFRRTSFHVRDFCLYLNAILSSAVYSPFGSRGPADMASVLRPCWPTAGRLPAADPVRSLRPRPGVRLV
jgi:hypothetical protein